MVIQKKMPDWVQLASSSDLLASNRWRCQRENRHSSQWIKMVFAFSGMANKARCIDSSNKCVQEYYKFWSGKQMGQPVIYADIVPWLYLCLTHLCNLPPNNRVLLTWQFTGLETKLVTSADFSAQILWNHSQKKFTAAASIKVVYAKTPLPRKGINTNPATNSKTFLVRLNICWTKPMPIQYNDSFLHRDYVEEKGQE